MRFCPITLKTSSSDTESVCVHISEDGYTKVKSQHVGTDKSLTEKIQSIYRIFGRETAGAVNPAVVKKYLRTVGAE